jgi:hypothetical protein
VHVSNRRQVLIWEGCYTYAYSDPYTITDTFTVIIYRVFLLLISVRCSLCYMLWSYLFPHTYCSILVHLSRSTTPQQTHACACARQHAHDRSSTPGPTLVPPHMHVWMPRLRIYFASILIFVPCTCTAREFDDVSYRPSSQRVVWSSLSYWQVQYQQT